MKAKKFKIICFSVAGVLLALLIALSAAVGACAGLLDKWVVGYKDAGANSASREKGLALAQQIQEEGTVLVKNSDEKKQPLLPLSKGDEPKVNVFGWASTDWVISGSGSGQVKRANSVQLLDNDETKVKGALTEYGIKYNTEITDMYEDFRANREFSINGGNAGKLDTGNVTDGSDWGSLHTFNFEFSRLYEPSIKDTNYYTASMLENAKTFSDTAIVVIGRVSGESNDSPAVQYKQTTKGSGQKNGKLTGNELDSERTYLEISTEEEELLTYVGSNYDNVIVLINSTNVMELGFLETIPGLDACLIVATTGTAGARAIPKIIYGDVNPSGKTADTYAYDLSTAATYVDAGKGNDTTHFYSNTINPNFNGNTSNGIPSGSSNSNGVYPTNEDHTNGSTNVPYEGAAYQDYREGVYVGYKWYETADEAGFWDTTYAKNKWGISKGYEEVVQYPFGYGLSYTDFSWEIKYLEQPNGTTLKPDDKIKLTVRVTNIGDVPGQDVVELYYSAPYKDGKDIEKSSVNLAAFGKTQKVLAKGEYEDVDLELTVSDMASYDYDGKKIQGGGYVLEDGTYTLTLRTDAHTKAGKKVSGGVHGNDTLTYKISGDTRCLEEAENRFTGTDTTDGVAIDGNSDGTAEITYLSRADFAGTFPAEFGENRSMPDNVKALNLYNATQANAWDAKWQAANPNATALNANGDSSKGQNVGSEISVDGKKVYQLNDYGIKLGLDYDDPEWENLLDRIPKSQMQQLVLHGYTKTSAVAAIGKPATIDFDGPNQVASFTDGYATKTGFSSIVLAQSWNLELAYSMGLTFGAECAENGFLGWYGPGVNVHRSPFGGRNYEYYSEDALMSGLMCARVVSAAKNRGVFCYLKHICLYEGESGRDGMYTWVTEQALREIYLKPFELAVKKGGSNAIMTSYGRIGAVWTGGSEALLTEVCRGEWGFKGCFLTDYADHHKFMNGDQMVRAGGDLWMDGYQNNGSFAQSTTSIAYDNALRRATKNVLYMWMNSLATNAQYNESADDIVIPVSAELNFRWYIPVLVVVDVLFAAGAGVLIFFGIKKKDKPVAEAENVTEASANSDPSSPAEETVDTTETPDAPNE